MSAYRDLAAGLRTVLSTGLPGWTIYDYPPDSLQAPCAVILPEAMDPEQAFQGNTFTATFRVVALLASADAGAGFLGLYDAIDPTAANTSVIKAIRDDPTLNGKADSSGVTRIENIGRREIAGGFYFGFDALVETIVTVA